MRNKTSVLLFIVSLSLTIYSCSKDEGLSEEEVQTLISQSNESNDYLIGTWTSSNRYGFTFKADGTGQWWNINNNENKKDMDWLLQNNILSISMNLEGQKWELFNIIKISDSEIIMGQGTVSTVYIKQSSK